LKSKSDGNRLKIVINRALQLFINVYIHIYDQN